MGIIVTDCPHCGLAEAAMTALFVSPWPAERNVRTPGATFSQFSASVGANCPRCFNPVAAILLAQGGLDHGQSGLRFSQFQQHAADHTLWGLTLLEIWPKKLPPRIPEHLSPDAERALLQAERNFSMIDHEEAAGMMYRRALELALKHRFPTVTGKLAARIKKLVAAHDLPSTIGEWADEVREIGNEAAHDAGPLTGADLVAMRDFTDAVLRYAISLPEEIARRRAVLAEAVDGS